MDDIDWDMRRYNDIVETLSPFLRDSCGYDLNMINWIPISGLTGDNLLKKKKTKKNEWF